METSAWRRAKERQVEYGRRDPTDSALYRIVYHLRQELEWRWEDRFQHVYGCLREAVLKALDAYLNCGILLHGCARIVCEQCKHSELLAFSCKRRCLCPSCDAKRALLFGEHLHNNILLPYLHAHTVFTIPKRLRPFFKFDRRLLNISTMRRGRPGRTPLMMPCRI